MNNLLMQNNYVVVDNFLTENQTKELYSFFINDINSKRIGYIDSQCGKNAISVYNYRWFTELHINKIISLSEFMQESILPTYSYARLYNKGSFLEKHTDRNACEISITAHLGSDGTSWPLYFTKPNGESVGIDLNPGQAVIYLGRESVHWRDEYQGMNYAQIFFHYVRSRGPYWDEVFDYKRIKNEQY